MTVFVTTAYLDEAERCNRVGLIHRGRLIRCDPPDVLKKEIGEACFEVRSPNQRSARELLRRQKGVLSVEPSGETLHLFLSPQTSVDTLQEVLKKEGIEPFVFNPIVPSLEDIFIALVRKAPDTESAV